MSTQPKVDTESSFFRFIIVGGLVIGVLVLFAICLGVSMLVMGRFSSGTGGPEQDAAQEKEAQAVAQAFLADLRAGNAQAAYQKTSKRYRSLQPMGEFQAQFQQHNWLQSSKDKNQKTTSLHRDVSGRPSACSTLITVAEGEGDTAAIHIDTAREGDAWKVDDWHADR
jgi:hypothetical protein